MLALLFFAIVVIVLLAVFFRYVLNDSLFWSDDTVRYLFVWFTLLGSVVVLRDRRQIRVEYFVEHLPSRWRRVIEVAMFVLVTLLYLFFVVAGFMWVWATSGTTTSSLKLPLNWVFYAALPITGLLGLFYCVRRLRAREVTELEMGASKQLSD
ncbi:MAG: TRAP transporter small permease [Pirellulales bacterium]